MGEPCKTRAWKISLLRVQSSTWIIGLASHSQARVPTDYGGCYPIVSFGQDRTCQSPSANVLEMAVGRHFFVTKYPSPHLVSISAASGVSL